MKKLKGFLAILAIAFAGVGIYTTSFSAVQTQAWINDPSAGTPSNCDISVTTPCILGTAAQCNVSSAGNQLVYRMVSGTCSAFIRK